MSFQEDFLTTDHESMTENLNRISDDLLKAKWYFLATIAALGIAYWRIYSGSDSALRDLPCYSFLIVSAVGNIVFWMIGEYIISHGFLFRFIQAKVAKIEKIAYKSIESLRIIIRDPTDETNYIRNCRYLSLDYILPDQFLPLYWASMWLIGINTGVAISLYQSGMDLLVFLLLCFSLFLIWKLLMYHSYKIRQFLKKTAFIQFVPACAKEIDFFCFPLSPFYGLPLGIVLCYLSWIFEFQLLPWYYWIVLPIFWPLALAMAAHFCRILDVFLDNERSLSVQAIKEAHVYKCIVQVGRRIVWAYWLLYFIV